MSSAENLPFILRQVMQFASPENIVKFSEPLENAMFEFGIVNKLRRAAFLAQVAVESGSLAYVREIASGEAYEGRKDIGNTEAGDGKKFRGRGLIQLTGRANYRECGKALGLDLLAYPEMLELPVNAARSAGWFWLMRGLNAIADTGDIIAVSKRVNGGTNGLLPRKAFYDRAMKALA